MSTVPAGLDHWIAERRDRVDAALRASLRRGDTPAGLARAMEYSVTAGGKRLRPLLVLGAAEAAAGALGAAPATALPLAMPAACAVELIHTYSLVHDDLPAMDDDTLRRGRPTAHVVFGEGLAILSGDALLTEAFVLLAREPEDEPGMPPDLTSRKLATIRTIAEAAGAAGMAGGQAIDLEAAATDAPPVDLAALRDMHARKTGALIAGSTAAGAIMAGATQAMREAVLDYGRHLGLAFQIMDDVLDVEGASAELGKTAGKDAAAGKPTYPALYGLEESRRLARESADRAVAALAAARLAGQLPAIARWVIARTH